MDILRNQCCRPVERGVDGISSNGEQTVPSELLGDRSTSGVGSTSAPTAIARSGSQISSSGAIDRIHDTQSVAHSSRVSSDGSRADEFSKKHANHEVRRNFCVLPAGKANRVSSGLRVSASRTNRLLPIPGSPVSLDDCSLVPREASSVRAVRASSSSAVSADERKSGCGCSTPVAIGHPETHRPSDRRERRPRSASTYP